MTSGASLVEPPPLGSGRKVWGTDLSDHTRFEKLVLPHLNAAYNLARWLTRDVNDAEDVVQDACVRALKYVGSLTGSSARAWFLTIVRHAFYDWCKRNRPAEIARDDGTAIDMAVDPAAVNPEQAFLRAAAGLSRGTDFARAGRAVVQGDRERRRNTDRHGNVAARARPRLVAAFAALARGELTPGDAPSRETQFFM